MYLKRKFEIRCLFSFFGLYGFFILLQLPQLAFAEYLNGHDLCAATEILREGEMGDYVQVPLEYSSNGQAADTKTTDIYYWTRAQFDPQLPTMIYFVGGPGGSAHGFSFYALKDWNIVYFDQRGIGCSRFASLDLATEGKYYSSEYIARDVDAIRRKLGIQVWSIYGQSYGTVPATIYAHLFKENTTALVIEGVIYKGDASLWNAPHRMKVLQRIFNELPEDLKNVVRKMSLEPGRNTLFSQVAFGFMYSDEPRLNIISYLNQVKSLYLDLPNADKASTDKSNTDEQSISASTDAFHTSIASMKPDTSDSFLVQKFGFDSSESETQNLLANSSNNFSAITCRELSAYDPAAQFYYGFKNDRFYIDENDQIYQQKISACQSFKIDKDSPLIKMYEAQNYPVYVPVTYLQGTTDGATEPNHAIAHYKKVPQVFKQLLLKKNGGHAPNLLLIASSLLSTVDSDQNSQKIQESAAQIFDLALRGQEIPKSVISEFNKYSGPDWLMTHSKPIP